ncbi:MAG TPA: hypothetical protein VFK45_02215 [Gammaproteobacteria bacterium]|nr:hypothetical protein [Gammaproteobacteria bacterium]
MPPSAARPHGLSYSLTLHEADSQGLVGFDNAHPVRINAGPAGRSRMTNDHRHRLNSLRGTLKIARGELKPNPHDPKGWFTSAESFAKVLSDRNRALLTEIVRHPPESLTALADKTGRQKSNLSRTLKTMERYVFVTLRKDARGRLLPTVPYQNIILTVPIESGESAPEAA